MNPFVKEEPTDKPKGKSKFPGKLKPFGKKKTKAPAKIGDKLNDAFTKMQNARFG